MAARQFLEYRFLPTCGPQSRTDYERQLIKKRTVKINFTVLFFVVRLGGFELPTHGLGNRCSIHLSYRRIRTLLF